MTLENKYLSMNIAELPLKSHCIVLEKNARCLSLFWWVGGWISNSTFFNGLNMTPGIKFINLLIFSFKLLLLSAFNLDFYTDVLDLNFLLDHIKDNPFTQKYKKLNEALVGLVEDYGLVSFKTLDIQVHVIKILVDAVQQ